MDKVCEEGQTNTGSELACFRICGEKIKMACPYLSKYTGGRISCSLFFSGSKRLQVLL